MLQYFTTNSNNRAERSRQWRALTQADDVYFGDDRQAHLRGGDFGSLRLCLVSMGTHCLSQKGGDNTPPGAPIFKFLFQEEGSASIRQAGREITLRPGQWYALRKDKPFEIEAPAHSRQLCITVLSSLMPGTQSTEHWRTRPGTFLVGPAQVLHASASASVLAGNSLNATDRAQLGDPLVRMVEMTICHDELDETPDVRKEQRRAVVEYIDRHLDRPDLDVEAIASDFNCSTRTIHHLFKGEAQTVSRLIWNRRLERCRNDIIDCVIRHRSITEIAHFWGFSDSEHFSRLFKGQYGMTPRDYRALYRVN